MEINFVGGAYQGRSLNLNAQVCQNLYPVLDNEGGKKVIALMNTPGLVEFASLGTGEVRGTHVMGSYLYAVRGNTVYRVDSAGTATAMTGTLDTSLYPVMMKNNGTQIMIVDQPFESIRAAGYILSGTTVTKITDSDFIIPSSLTYQDGYFIVSEQDSGRFFLSDSYDGTSWNSLMYATAEGDPDNLLAVVSANRELWLIGKTSYEVWYNSGNTVPFDRVDGAFNRIGIIAPYSAAEHQGLVAWLDNYRFVRMSSGYQAEKISTVQVDYQLAQYTTVSDAVGFIYSQEGHTFYVLTFPTEGKTWVYDNSTKYWHTRASTNLDARHRANCYALFEGMHIVGDFQNGKLYKYDLGTYNDNGEILRRKRAAQVVQGDRRRIFHKGLEIEFEGGVGLSVDDATIGSGKDPQAMLEWSDDGGHNWSNEHWTTIGKMGEYANRAVWRRLGEARERIYRVTVSDPVKCVILGAQLDAEAGTN